MAKVCPLHKVIDAVRWDTERPLGRLILVVHAAFLDAGFVPLGHPSGKRRPIPREAGRTASALSLRYTAPELVRLRRRGTQAAVVLRQQVYGRKIVLYVQRGDARPVASSWVVVADALAAGALLSGGLDVTARGLRRDARLAALWRGVSDGLCRRALADLCLGNGVALEPTFMSLPGDVKAAILARLPDAADLVRVERTCTALRRLVAARDRELWKPMYDALPPAASIPNAVEWQMMSWKQRYLRARLWRPTSWGGLIALSQWCHEIYGPPSFYCFGGMPADPASKRRMAARDRPFVGNVRTPPFHGQEKRRHGAGAMHTPSSSRGQDQEEWRHAAGAIHARSMSRGQEKRRHGAGAVHAPSSRY